MKTSLLVFRDHLIDYAGLFPPANLPLDSAIQQYANYKNGKDSWMLGPFVLPVTQFKNLDSYIHLFSVEKPLILTVVGRRCDSEIECRKQLKEDVKQISTIIQQYKEVVQVEVFEIPLPPAVPSQEFLEEISIEASKLKARVYCEVGLINDWKNHVTETLDTIEAHNLSKKTWVGVKLRTGGIKAEMFPEPEQVAFVIASCRDRNLPLKFTAGLHHPVRMYRDEVNTKMYGFLNIFIAGMLASTQELSLQKIEQILTEENSKHFSFSNDYIAWQNIKITTQQIKNLRETSLHSFGSCSFDEPKDELIELLNQQGVIL